MTARIVGGLFIALAGGIYCAEVGVSHLGTFVIAGLAGGLWSLHCDVCEAKA